MTEYTFFSSVDGTYITYITKIDHMLVHNTHLTNLEELVQSYKMEQKEISNRKAREKNSLNTWKLKQHTIK